VAQHVRVRPGDPHASGFSQSPQAAGGGMAIHPRPAGVAENRAAAARTDGAVDGPPDRWRQRDQDGLGAFAAHAQHPVAVFFAKISDVRTGGFEDPQAEQPEHGHQREEAEAARRAWPDGAARRQY